MRIAWKSVALTATALACLILSPVADAVAQRGSGQRSGTSSDGDQFLKSVGLKLGDRLPDVSGYDISGKPFELRDITGSYAVIVCGCMT